MQTSWLTKTIQLKCLVVLLPSVLLTGLASQANPLCTRALENSPSRIDFAEVSSDKVLKELILLRSQISKARAERAPSLARILAQDYTKKLAEAKRLGVPGDFLKYESEANTAVETQDKITRSKRVQLVETAERDYQRWQASKLLFADVREDVKADVKAVVQSPTELQMLIQLADGTLHMTNTANQTLAYTVPSKIDPWQTPVFSRDGKRFAFLAESGRVEIYTSLSGKRFRNLGSRELGTYIVDLNFDGSQLLTGAAVAEKQVASVWDVATGNMTANFFDPDRNMTAAKISPDGTRVLTEYKGHYSRLWNKAAEKEIAVIGKRGNFITSEFSEDGRFIYAFSKNGEVAIISADTGLLLQTLSGHHGAVYSIDVSRDGTLAVTAGADGKALIWDLRKNSTIRSLQLADQALSARILSNVSPGSFLIAILGGKNSIFLWDQLSGEVMRELKSESPKSYEHDQRLMRSTMTMAPDGNTIIVHIPRLAPTVWRRDSSNEGAP